MYMCNEQLSLKFLIVQVVCIYLLGSSYTDVTLMQSDFVYALLRFDNVRGHLVQVCSFS